jgi:hypothetical protein
MAPVIALLVALPFLPSILRSRKVKRARKLLQRASHEGYQERLRLQEEALELVADQPQGLLAVAEEALRRNMRSVAEEAAQRLGGMEKAREELRALQRKLDDGPVKTPEGVSVVIGQLLDQGQHDAARARLEEARRRWPRSEALDEVEQRLRRATAERAGGDAAR